MYALFTGVVTATEAAAVSCTLGLAICLARRKLSWKGFLAAVGDTVRISCMVFMIIAGAVIFGQVPGHHPSSLRGGRLDRLPGRPHGSSFWP